MKKQLKKVNKKLETFKKKIEKEENINRAKLFRFIDGNPGATVDELLDNYSGLDAYDFFKDMIQLYEEEDIVSDCGYFFPSEEVRHKMAEEGLY